MSGTIMGRAAVVLLALTACGCGTTSPPKQAPPSPLQEKPEDGAFKIPEIPALGLRVFANQKPFAMFVLELDEWGAAQRGGLETGDQITHVKGAAVESVERVNAMLWGAVAGDEILVTIDRWDAKGKVVPLRVQPYRPALLGIALNDKDDRGEARADIVDLAADGPAARAGARVGDIVRRVGGHEIKIVRDIYAALTTLTPGDEIALEVERDGSRRTLRATVGRRPEPKRYAPPGWEGSCRVDIRYLHRYGWKTGCEYFVKVAYPPAAESPVAVCIDFFSLENGIVGTIAPECLGAEGLPTGCHPFTLSDFVRENRDVFEVKLGDSTLWVQPDVLYRGMEITGSAPQGIETPVRREFVIELHRAKPSGFSAPFRSILIGTRLGTLDNVAPWEWRDPREIVLNVDGRLWTPAWKIEKSRLASIQFTEREWEPAEALKLRPLPGVAPEEMNACLLRWKDKRLPDLLRAGAPETLRDLAALAKATILQADQEAERIEQMEPNPERSGAWRSRIEILKSIQAAIEAEIANRER